MVWTDKQIKQHKKAAEILIEIKDLVFDYFRKNSNCSEYEVQKFILEKFKEKNLINERDVPIVAFGKNTSHVHYFPTENCSALCDECLILIDIWARLNEVDAPYADITWMAYKGKTIPKKFSDVFDFVVGARDNCVNFIKNNLEKGNFPRCIDAHKDVCDFFEKKNVLNKFKHGTGHSLGRNDPHGDHPPLNYKSEEELIKQNLGFTIEPGLYFENKFGVRTEINFYINSNDEIIITTPLQKEIIMI